MNEARQAQSTKNNQFTIFLQYLIENMNDKIDFLPADKCWTFFQIDTIILGVCGHACPNYLKQKVCYFSTTCEERSEWCSWFFTGIYTWKLATNWY